MEVKDQGGQSLHTNRNILGKGVGKVHNVADGLGEVAKRRKRGIAIVLITAAAVGAPAAFVELTEDTVDLTADATGNVVDVGKEVGQRTVARVVPDSWVPAALDDVLSEEGGDGVPPAAEPRPGDPITPPAGDSAPVPPTPAPAPPAVPNSLYTPVVPSITIVPWAEGGPGPSTPNQATNVCAGRDVPGSADAAGTETANIWADISARNPGVANGLQAGEVINC